MTRWLRCPAVLIVPLIALILFVRSDQRGPSETTPPELLRGERLLLRKTPSTADETSPEESTSLPSRLAAEQKSGSIPSGAAESNSAQPPQPLPGTHLDPASYSAEPRRPSAPSAKGAASGPSVAPARERPSDATPMGTASRRTFVKHRVVDGDDLRGLAQRYLNSADRALEIFHANRDVLSQPDLLPLGAELQIPLSLP